MPAAPPQDDPRIGTVLVERYQILERLSAGAMGVVYRAERLKLGRVVAVKFLHSAFAFSDDFTKRFDLEARTMSRLDHPHCVSVIDFGVADAPFIVMDFVTGTTLKDLVASGPLPPARALAIARQVLAGLAHAHEKGIVHRDIKPANIMLTQATGTGDHVRILDFGLAKLVDAEQSVSSVVVGTPSYMSPEQAGAKKVDARADVYATAVVLFELLTGVKPFHHEQALQLIRMHIEKPPPDLAEKRPDVAFSPELEAAVKKGLAKSPDDRFQTPEAFAAALEVTPEYHTRPASIPSMPPVPRARTGGTFSRAGTHPLGPDGRPLTPLVPLPAQLGDATAIDPPAPRRPVRSFPIGWIVLVVALVGGGLAWNKLGRPGWPTAKPAAVAAPAVPSTMAGVRTLLARGDREAALRLLHDLGRKSPHSGEIQFMVGELYFQKGWLAEMIAAYLKAVVADAGYKANATINQRVIAALGDPKVRERAQAALRKIGAPALPYLKVAAKDDKNPDVRRAAAQLVAELGK
jgi:hypothetical protein